MALTSVADHEKQQPLYISFIKNVDIEFSAHDSFLDWEEFEDTK
jgi:hypothetical protein